MKAEKAVIGDIDALVDLRLAFLQEDDGPLEARLAEEIRERLPDYFRAHLDRDLFVFIVREDGRIVSCAFLLIVEKPMSPAFPNGKTGTVLNVYTCPSFRRRGYAESVMKALLAEAKEKNLFVVELKSTEAGYSLYKKAGFSDDHSKYRLMNWTGSQQ